MKLCILLDDTVIAFEPLGGRTVLLENDQLMMLMLHG